MKEMSKDDIKRTFNEQCKMSQEDILLYDEGKGKTTVETHADFYISENAFSITYVGGNMPLLCIHWIRDIKERRGN